MKYTIAKTELYHKAFYYLMQKHNINEDISDDIYNEIFINIPIALKDFEQYESVSLAANLKMKVVIDYKYKIRMIKDEMLKKIKLNNLAKEYNLSLETIINIIDEWEHIYGAD